MKACVVFVCVLFLGMVFALQDIPLDGEDWSIEEQKVAYFDTGSENDDSQSLHTSSELEDKDPYIVTKSQEQKIDKEVDSFIKKTLEKDAYSLKDYPKEDNRSDEEVPSNTNQIDGEKQELFTNEVIQSNEDEYNLSPVKDISIDESDKQDVSVNSNDPNLDDYEHEEYVASDENKTFESDENLKDIIAETSYLTANSTNMDKIIADAQKILAKIDSTEMDQVDFSYLEKEKIPAQTLESDENLKEKNLKSTTIVAETQNLAKEENQVSCTNLDSKQIPVKTDVNNNNSKLDLESLFGTWNNLTEGTREDVPEIFRDQVEDIKNNKIDDKTETNENSESYETYAEVGFDTLFADFKETTKSNNEKSNIEETTSKSTSSAKYIPVASLTNEQYDFLMQQFSSVNAEDLETSKIQKTEPTKIHLDGTNVTTVTSPNYPNPYPTDQIVDWIIEGDGTGMELIITDFKVNGALGDYLLFKPGGEDASGNQGIILSYHIDHERKFRFLNVNRMFVRFEAKKGMAFTKGFSFNIKMIFPVKKDSIDDVYLPPEALLPAPRHTLTIHLGGIAYKDFYAIEDDFKKLVADMGTLYINSNGIDTEINTLSAIQITRDNICNINWPGFESCVEVSFGIPVVNSDDESRLNEEELRDMWYTYIYQDPFAARLKRMGIEEFNIPNDGAILMWWMTVAFAAAVSMAAVAFVLWRFSCFEEYTRMQTFSDTDSIFKEKRPLDLYPTPHQTLPPLYGDLEHPWEGGSYGKDARVNISGYNKGSFAQDDLLDFESDGERTKREGNSKTKIVHDLV